MNSTVPGSNHSKDSFTRFIRQIPATAPAGERREWLNPEDPLPQGIRLPDGNQNVIVHPDHPLEFRCDTPSNREEFRRRWCTWSQVAKNETARLYLEGLPSERLQFLKQATVQRSSGLAVIEKNLLTSPGSGFPWLQEPAWYHTVFQWDSTIRRASKTADLSENLLHSWMKSRATPASSPWPLPFQKAWLDTNGLYIYSIDRMDAVIHVVSAFITPLVFELDPQTLEPRASLAAWSFRIKELVWNTYIDWVKSSDSTAPHQVFFTLGLAGEHASIPSLLQAAARLDRKEIVWAFDSEGELVHDTVFSSATPSPTLDFADLLLPETEEARVEKVRLAIERLRAVDYPGVTVEKIALELKLRMTVVRQAFLTLQDQNPEVYLLRHDHDEDLGDGRLIEVFMPEPGHKKSITAQMFHLGWWRRNMLMLLTILLAATLSTLVSQWKDSLKPSLGMSIMITALGAICGSQLQKWADRKIQKER